MAERATTDVHVLHNGRSLFDGLLNLNGSANEVAFTKTVSVSSGDTIDCVVGSGNEHYGADTTGLAFAVKLADKTYDATAEFSTDANPNGVWSYGQLAAGPAPDASTFVLYADYPAGDGRTRSAALPIPAPRSGKTC